ncbi:MAG: MYXO-CTERM domain-containing protein [Cognaticolwellia sp.]|jgi:MYXO-CTERM domain-containing protein
MILLLSTLASAQSYSTLSPGVDYARWSDGTSWISATRIHLCSPGIRMRATASDDRGQKTSSWASSEGAVAAVNGGFFKSGYAPDYGRAAGYGAEWPESAYSGYRSAIVFGEHAIEHFPAPSTTTFPSWGEEAVNGDATLVLWGEAVDCGGCGSGRAPRTAVGYSEDAGTLYLVTVDGRTTASQGMSIDELAVLMHSIGAYRAMNMDGGGSTTMWTSSAGVVNSPSDGSERTVGNHLGVLATSDPLTYNCPTGWQATWGTLNFPGASGATLSAPAGSVVSGSLSVTNTGTTTWDPASTRLAPLPRDASSPVSADDWIAASRVTGVDAITAPGEIGTFSFSFTMPETVGSSTRWEFAFVEEFVRWFGSSWGPEDGTYYLTLVATEPIQDTGEKETGPTETGDSEPQDSEPDDTQDGDTAQRGQVTDPDPKDCTCSSTPGMGSLWGVLLLGLLVRRRRRDAQTR